MTPKTEKAMLTELRAYRRLLRRVWKYEANQMPASEVARLTSRLERLLKQVAATRSADR